MPALALAPHRAPLWDRQCAERRRGGTQRLPPVPLWARRLVRRAASLVVLVRRRRWGRRAGRGGRAAALRVCRRLLRRRARGARRRRRRDPRDGHCGSLASCAAQGEAGVYGPFRVGHVEHCGRDQSQLPRIGCISRAVSSDPAAWPDNLRRGCCWCME